MCIRDRCARCRGRQATTARPDDRPTVDRPAQPGGQNHLAGLAHPPVGITQLWLTNKAPSPQRGHLSRSTKFGMPSRRQSMGQPRCAAPGESKSAFSELSTAGPTTCARCAPSSSRGTEPNYCCLLRSDDCGDGRCRRATPPTRKWRRRQRRGIRPPICCFHRHRPTRAVRQEQAAQARGCRAPWPG